MIPPPLAVAVVIVLALALVGAKGRKGVNAPTQRSRGQELELEL